MELYIFDVACSAENRLSDSRLASDLLRIVANEDIGGIAGVSDKYSLLLPSEAGRVALLGELLHVHDPELQRSIPITTKGVCQCCSQHFAGPRYSALPNLADSCSTGFDERSVECR